MDGIVAESYIFPFQTEKLSQLTPMVLLCYVGE